MSHTTSMQTRPSGPVKWQNGWLRQITKCEGYFMVRTGSDRPFVMSSDEWSALPDQPTGQEMSDMGWWD